MEQLFSAHGWTVTLEEAPLPDGRVKKIARVHRADSSHILAFDNAKNVLLLREFRPFYGEYIWMLPSGRVDKETDMHEGAQRELREETGFRAAKMKHLWTVHHSESLAFANHIFLARDLIEDPLEQDHDELIEVHRMYPEEALEKVLASPKVHLPSAYALLRYLREKEEI
jgi:8-oxo-dGTP pyrophosphatase MutT (NUDIX family)